MTSIATARLYGVKIVGEFALAYAPTGAVWFLSSVREAPALIKALAPFSPRAPRVTGMFAAVFAFSSALTLVVATLAVGVSYWVFNGPIYHPSLFWPSTFSLICYFLIVNSCWNIDTVLAAFRAAGPLFWVRLHQVALNLALIFIAAQISRSVWSVLIAVNASWTTALLHRLVVIRRYVRWSVPSDELRAGFRALPEIVRFGLRLTPGSVAYGVSNECGTWILGAVSPIAAVGAYNRASGLAQRFLEVNYRLTEMLLPTLVERRATGDRTGFDRALIDSLRYVGSALLVPAAAGGGAAVGIMGLFGPGFGRGADALAVLLVVPAVTTMSQMQVNALIADNRPLTTTVLALIRTIITVALSVLLVRPLGGTGVAAALLGGAIIQLLLQLAWTRTQLERPFLWHWPPRHLVALGLAYGVTFASSRFVYESMRGALGVIVALMLGSLVFLAVAVSVGGLLPRDRVRIRELWQVVRLRLGLGQYSAG